MIVQVVSHQFPDPPEAIGQRVAVNAQDMRRFDVGAAAFEKRAKRPPQCPALISTLQLAEHPLDEPTKLC